ncbi:unnamed protein product [Prunus armeniaca]
MPISVMRSLISCDDGFVHTHQHWFSGQECSSIRANWFNRIGAPGEIRSKAHNWNNLGEEELHVCTEAIDRPTSNDRSPRGLEHGAYLGQEMIDHPTSTINRPKLGTICSYLPETYQSCVEANFTP